jgi:hypothetical protein
MPETLDYVESVVPRNTPINGTVSTYTRHNEYIKYSTSTTLESKISNARTFPL